MQEKRDELRRIISEKRKSLTPEEVEGLSRRICEKLGQIDKIAHARVIMGFSSIRNEVNLMPWLETLRREKIIVLPRVIDEENMEAIEYRGREYTKSGPFGIVEPVGEPFDPQKIDVVLVPGLVFDVKGYRLGYGRGYYDRFLPRLRKDAFLCGVCYDFQVVETVYPHAADFPVHWIVTDKSEVAVNWNYF
ncbi:5-formyltetrahydrofolate cyclo-ligase [Thermosyntropha lipolytica DSM 11003]|uniref:5-formyltetrahydrofolate cyclo-ligase n=1 Tax=Thermosyntropha lipolytica DSM 11003 TaxID=1123382 RepID=A0A1M5JE66_9FIRM|nr:5-formyltetrahydrofolate cyclo-ligase [Thermosyntropha lipolytica]SHG38896.1 5-formyltetrahydrofolate cyclo-ligase [Thermosyntropha lipolytica DSM 11003]